MRKMLRRVAPYSSSQLWFFDQYPAREKKSKSVAGEQWAESKISSRRRYLKAATGEYSYTIDEISSTEARYYKMVTYSLSRSYYLTWVVYVGCVIALLEVGDRMLYPTVRSPKGSSQFRLRDDIEHILILGDRRFKVEVNDCEEMRHYLDRKMTASKDRQLAKSFDLENRFESLMRYITVTER